MSSRIIDIPTGDESVFAQKKKSKFSFISAVASVLQRHCTSKQFIHSIKVGIALVLVSLLYLLDPLYEQVGENAMWAIMTVVVVFEFFAGATLSKGLNRAIGTLLGGVLGCLAAVLADEASRTGNAITVSTCVFIFGAAATYCRLVPSIKRRYDYAAMIFILTFNLVAVSGLRADKMIELASERLKTIGMGFVVCICISLLVFPMWASDELHNSTASRFDKLACCIEACLEEYFRTPSVKEDDKSTVDFSGCKSILYSKSTDESQANFARWEPWHGKFGFLYPWDKYLHLGEGLRELAATILSLKGSLQSRTQPSSSLKQTIKEPCQVVGSSLAWTLRELGESLKMMRRCQTKVPITPKLQAMKLQLRLVLSPVNVEGTAAEENSEGLAIASFVYQLMEMADKVEVLGKEVENLGQLAGFQI